MVVDLQGKLRQALGSVKDHASIGKAMMHNLHHGGFSEIEIAVLRATGHENTPIHDKHIHEILFLVCNSPAASIPFLAERISRRLGKTRDLLVALKTLVLIHRLLRGGNRSFEKQLRGAHKSGHLQMSTNWLPERNSTSDHLINFLQNYSNYLQERMGWMINQAGKLEPTSVIAQGCYQEKSIHMVFRVLPKCQVFMDRVLACSPFNILPSDNLAQAAMSNILKESFQVYMTFCEGIATLVNMFFDLTRPARALASEILKRASQQSQQLHHLYQDCKQIIENRNLEYPSVQIITTEHVMALEQCLSSLQDHPILSSIKDDDEKNNGFSLSTTVFSWSLETKINKVWVVFEDEDPIKSPHHTQTFFNSSISEASTQEIVGTQTMITRETKHNKTHTF